MAAALAGCVVVGPGSDSDPGTDAGDGDGDTAGDGDGDTAGDTAGDGNGDGDGDMGLVVDLSVEALIDVNATSATFEQTRHPNDYQGKVSGWYFGHST